MNLRKLFSSLGFMGFATLVLFPLIAWPILYFTETPYFSIFQLEFENIYSIPTFLALGILFGLFMIWLSEHPYFSNDIEDYKKSFSGYKITIWWAIYLSICAGVGEEIFFRGALQPIFGIWLTSVFFVAIHTYFSFKNWKKNILAIFLTMFIVLLGWSAKNESLWHAIAGHFSYDLVLLLYLRKEN